MRPFLVLAVLLVAGLANFLVWSLPNRPVELEPPPGGKLLSASFAPFRDHQSPLTQTYPSKEEIDEDMAAIAPQVAGIRTYTSLEGMEVVPELARKHGLTVTMGAWLSEKPLRNEEEITALIDLANRYPDVITRVIVGNEVLLRRELPVEAIIRHLDRVRAAIRQPVSYADVWEWWLKYPQLVDHVDYVTIHLLPYWEDVPASVDEAMGRIAGAHRAVVERFPGKPVLVGETGWPTAGRQRGPAAPGLVEKARFVNAFARLAAEQGFDYNVIEAFDQNWKQALEGTVGGHWGLYDADRRPKFSLAGPVVENPRWPVLFAVSTALAAALFAVVILAGRPMRPGTLAVLGAASQGFATAFVFAADRALAWNHYWHDVALGALLLTLQAVLALAVLMGLRRALAGGGWRGFDRAGATAAVGLGLLAAAWSWLIILDGRYRDFPNPDMLIPAFGLLALGAARLSQGAAPAEALAIGRLFGGAGGGAGWIERALAAALLTGAAATVAAEGWAPLESILNGQAPVSAALAEVDWTAPNLTALSWAGLQFLLAVPYAASLAMGRRRSTLRAA